MAEKRIAILEKLREKVAEFPATSGVYFFKDAAGVVLYIGKAKSLRPRVASYLQPSADLLAGRGPEIARMIDQLAADVDYLECDSEVDALLRESRLIKDIQPRFNAALKDDSSFPYLQITADEDFPRVAITRTPRGEGVKLYGPFVYSADLRAALPLMQRVFKFRTCNLEIREGDEARVRFRPCLLYHIKQCTAPCAAYVTQEQYAQQIRHLKKFLASKGGDVRADIEKRMKEAASSLQYEQAARYRDELKALEMLQHRGLVDQHPQPEVFFVDPSEGLIRLAEVLSLRGPVRIIEAIDIAHLGGQEAVGSLACFIDGRAFKSNYRRYRIRLAQGGDDPACIREVVSRRYRLAAQNAELFPDVILIDGGKGQLNAAGEAFASLGVCPPMMIALAKKEEEIYTQDRLEPLRLPRRDPGLRLLQAVRDEAHRFAQHYHHILRRRAILETDRPVRRSRRKRGQPSDGTESA